MADQWDPAAFGLSATSAPAAGSTSSSASTPLGAPAKSDAGSWDPAAFGLQAAPAAAAGQSGGSDQQSALPPGTKTGFVANAAAGAVEGAAGGLNALSDPFGNLIGKPASIILGAAHDALAPVFGYHKFSDEERAALFGDDAPQIGDRVVGAVQRAIEAPSLDTVQPGSYPESLVRAGTAGAVGMLGMGAGGAAEGALAKAGTAGLGAAGGVTGQLAATAAPDEYKPVANLVGNIVGAGIPTTAANVARSAIGKPLGDYAAPALGLRNTLLDPAGAPIAGADGVPLTASANQVRLAGNDLQAITSDPAAVRATLADPPPSPVPGVQLTTAQLTRDPGIGMQEYRASKGDSAVAFKSRQDQQNDARVAALQGVGDNADPSAVPSYLQQQAADIRSAGDDRVTQAQSAAQAQIDQARTGTDQQAAGLQAQAGQALDAIGGNLPAGSDAQIGQMLRNPIQESLAQARQRESALWNAIDPDGTLAVDMSPVRDKANEIVKGIGPNAAPPAGEEASILGTAQALPDVQNFSDLTDLRSRLTGQIRDARMGGRDQEVRRLSLLLDGVHDTMEGSVNRQSAADNAAVQAGTMAPEDAMMARAQASVDRWRADRNAQARTGTTGLDNSASFEATTGGRASTVSGSPRAGNQANSGSGTASGYSSVSSQPLTPNFDEAAQQRYADARQATADRVATYKNAPGVGQALQQGPTSGSFKTPDSALPSVIIRPGPQGANIAQAYLRAGGSVQELSNAAAYALRQHAMRPDGTLDPARYQTWARDRAGFLSQIPDAAARFGAAADAQRAAADAAGSSSLTLKQATATAQKTVDDAMTARAMATKALQNSVLGKFLDGSDSVARVGSILRDKAMGRVQMAQLAKSVEGNSEAKAGLQRAIGDFITRELVGNTKGIESESGAIKADRFQTFLRSAEPALREALTPEQVAGLKRVGASLEQTNFISQVGPGSPTAQLTAGRNETLMSRITKGIGEYATGGGAGGAIGFAVGGPVGSYIGTGAGLLVGKAVQAAREAGIENVEQLKTQALLNPALFNLLLTKANRNSEPALMNRLATQFRRISLVGGVQASDEAEKQARKVQPVKRAAPLPLLRSMPQNSLMSNDAPPPRRLNSLLSGPSPR